MACRDLCSEESRWSAEEGQEEGKEDLGGAPHPHLQRGVQPLLQQTQEGMSWGSDSIRSSGSEEKGTTSAAKGRGLGGP